MGVPSIVDVPETELVALLYSEPFLFSNLAIPPQTPGPIEYRLRLAPADLGLPANAFGDLDSLIVARGDFANARGTEFKRVKVSTSTFFTGQPNKLQELQKAAVQANVLARLGLSRVWIQVIAVTDAREVTGGRHVLVPGVFEVRDKIRESIPFHELHPAVGVHVMHLVQPVDRPVPESGQLGGDVMRHATPQLQPQRLTEAIRQLFRPAAGHLTGA